jgi:peptidoglycan/xylan/chitin deacetylase (PgdA/CDA1 family)
MPSLPLVRTFAAVCGVIVLAGCASTISAGEPTVESDGSGESGRVAAAPLTSPTVAAPVAPAVPIAPAVAAPPVAVSRASGSNSTAGFGPVTAYPRPAIYSLPPAKRGKIVYLTFDDGPTPYTTEVLTLLKRYNAKATFFVIGNQVGKRIPTVKRAYRDGHAVENHTWSHPTLTRLTWSQFRSQVARTNVAIAQATGDAPECLRAPYGTIDRNVLLRAQRFNLPAIQWSIDSRDWAKPGTSRIVRNVLGNVKDGSIVLMHDGGGNRAQTVAALKYILPALRKQGYAIRALPCGVNR